MDIPQINQLLYALPGGGSRRALLTKLSAGLAALLASLNRGVHEASAACAKPGKKCGKGKGNGNGNGNDRKCCAGSKCQGKRCRCRSGLTRCGTVCIDTSQDKANCGACGVDCGAGDLCDGGQCIPG